MASGTTPSRWKIVVLQVAALAIAFVVGRYCAMALGNEANSPATKKTFAKQSASPENPKSKTSATVADTRDDLATAKAALDKILHIPGRFNRERALLDFAAGLNTETLKSLLADLAPHVSSGNNHDAVGILLGQWAETDPQAALDFWKTIPRHFFDFENEFDAGIFDAWSAKDPAAALAAISQLPLNLRGYPTHAVLENMVRQDPQAALAALRTQPALGDNVELYGELFSKLAERDPVAAAASALTLSGEARNEAVDSVISFWADKDPAAAMAWARTLPAGDMRDNAVESIVSQPVWQIMDAKGPQAAIDYLKQLPGNTDFSSTIDTITFNWAQSDPNGLLAWEAKNPSDHSFSVAVANAINNLSLTDLATAANTLTQLGNANVTQDAIPHLAATWAKLDAQAALKWALSLTTSDAETRTAAVSTVLNQWADQNPADTAAYIMQNLASDPAYGALMKKVTDNWAGNDPQAALAWAQKLPDGDAQTSAIKSAIAQLAETNPQTALADALQLPDATRDQAIEATIKSWSRDLPIQAAAALVDLPPGNELNAATADVAKNWLWQDPAAASQWIDSLPQGPARDSAVTQILSVVGKNDPASAFTWATSIGDPTLRNKQVVDLVTQWNGINPIAAANAAQNALNLSNLTDEQQTALQKLAAKTMTP